MEPLNLNTEQPTQDPLLRLNEDNAGVPVPLETAGQRAFKARFGLSSLTTPYDEYLKGIMQGKEDQLRQKAASDIDFQKQSQKQSIISNYATQNQAPLTAGNMKFLDDTMRSLSNPTDPTSVFEEYYSKEFMAQLAKTGDINQATNFLNEAAKLDPQGVKNGFDVGAESIAKREFLLKQSQDIHNSIQDQSTLGWLADQAKFLVPGYSDLKLRGNAPDVNFLSGGLLGNNLENQAQALVSLPFEEMKAKVTTILDKLRKDNPSAALMFSAALLGTSSGERNLTNLGNAIDLSVLSPVVTGLAKGARAGVRGFRGAADVEALTVQTRQAVKDMVSAAADPEVSKASIITATGDVAEGGIQKATTNLLKDLSGSTEPEKRAVEALPTYLRLDKQNIKENPGRLSRDVQSRIEAGYTNLETNIVDTITNRVQVERIPAVKASEDAIRAIHEDVKNLYPGLSNSVRDIVGPFREPASNTNVMEVHFGTPTGELFNSPEMARIAANYNGFKDAAIEQQGAGFYFKKFLNLNETSDVVRDGLLKTDITKSPDGFLKSFTGWLRTAEDVLSPAQAMNRKTATFGPSNLIKLAADEAASIGKLMRGSRFRQQEVEVSPGVTKMVSKKDLWQDWERVVKASRSVEDPATGKPGYFFQNPVELDNAYMQHIKRLPSDAETEAYFAYKRFLELDRTIRNIAVYRNKARVGAETHAISVLGEDGKMVKSADFEGVVRPDLPGGNDTIMITGAKEGKETFIRGNDPQYIKIRKSLKKDVEEGRKKVIEIYDPETRPLEGFASVGDKRVRYVITDNVESKQLSWDQVPRRGGGHFDYDYDLWIKQAKIRPESIDGNFHHWYEGDTTVMPVSLRSMGSDIAEKLNTVRELIRDGKSAEAEAFSSKNIPINWKEVDGWFKPSHTPEGKKIPARLSVDEPFTLVPNNKLIVDLNKDLENRYPKTFQDGSKSGSLARQYQVAYTGERDAYDLTTFKDIGTRNNPIYDIAPAQMVDPIPSMHRALGKIVNSLYLDDYKTFSVEHWLQEAKDYLKASNSEIKYAPFWHFNNPEFKRGVPIEDVSRLKAQHFQIQQLMGVPSVTDSFLHSLSQKIADSAYTTFGPKGLVIDPDWILPKLRDPFRFVRAVTYHTTLGLFSIPTLLTQLQTHATIAAIAGVDSASRGIGAAQLYAYTRINRNPEIISHLDGMATKLGFKSGEFTEAMKGMEATGFGNVGGEYMNLNNALTPNVVSNTGQQFLDAGATFFKMGESNVRYGAWFTAYKEFRDVHPSGAITNSDWQGILNRADLLNINMSRASASIMNSGALSVTTQFLTYQLRQAELFFSDRIGATVAERNLVRARMLAVNAALYGAPVSAGVAGFPVADFIRKKAVEQGYVVGDKYLSSAVMEGLPAVMLALATGQGDMQKGNFYNIGQKLGSQGFQTINDIMSGDKSWWNIVGGAAFSKFSSAFEALDPLYQVMMSPLRDDDKYFKVKAEDMAQIFKEIGAVNTAWRSIMAANTSRWMSKKGIFLEDKVSPLNAIFMGVTGLQPQEAMDLSVLSASKKDEDERQKTALKHFLGEFRKGLLAEKDNSGGGADYFSRAFAYLKILGYPDEKKSSAISRAMNENKSLLGRVTWDYYIQGVSSRDRATMTDAYRRTKQIQEKKAGE